MNMGYVGYDEKNIYYYSLKDNALKEIDAHNFSTTLYKGDCSYINVYKNYIYFINENSNICKININNKKVENLIIDKKINYLYIVNDKLYAICRKNDTEKQQIILVDLVSNDVKTVLDDILVEKMLVYNDKIYYSYQEQLFCSDDINKPIIDNIEYGDYIAKFFIIDKDIYYINDLLLGKLKKYNMENQKCENVISSKKYNNINASCFNFNDNIFLFEVDEIFSDKLYIYDLKNKSKKISSLNQKIRNKINYTLFIASDKLIYYNNDDIYISDINGKNIKKIE